MYMPYVRYKFESNKSKNNFILLRESDAKIRIKIVSHTQEPYKKTDFSIFFLCQSELAPYVNAKDLRLSSVFSIEKI